jgi:hypothetical protein
VSGRVPGEQDRMMRAGYVRDERGFLGARISFRPPAVAGTRQSASY